MSDAADRSADRPVLPDGLDTPALVIDLDVVERNARRLAAALGERGIALRPHVKTHKSTRSRGSSSRRRARGSRSATSARPRSSRRRASTTSSSPTRSGRSATKATRLRALHAVSGLTLAVGLRLDRWAARLAAAVAGPARPLRVCSSSIPATAEPAPIPSEPGELAAAAQARSGSRFAASSPTAGMRTGPAAAESAGADEVRGARPSARTRCARRASSRRSSAPARRRRSSRAAAVAGERDARRHVPPRRPPAVGRSAPVPSDGLALAVAATVVSAAVDGQVVIDAGAKTLTKDVAPYLAGHGAIPAYPEAVIERVSDYHGVVESRRTPAPRAWRGRRGHPEPRLPGRRPARLLRRDARRRHRRHLAGRRARPERMTTQRPPERFGASPRQRR